MTFPHHSTALFKVIATTYLPKGHYLVLSLLDFTFTTTDHSHAKSLSSSSKAYTVPSTLPTASLPASPLSSSHVLSADFAEIQPGLSSIYTSPLWDRYRGKSRDFIAMESWPDFCYLLLNSLIHHFLISKIRIQRSVGKIKWQNLYGITNTVLKHIKCTTCFSSLPFHALKIFCKSYHLI